MLLSPWAATEESGPDPKRIWGRAIRMTPNKLETKEAVFHS